MEAFGKDVRPRELEEVLRLEYRSKLLNPKVRPSPPPADVSAEFRISRAGFFVSLGKTLLHLYLKS